jgi:uncharacterized protein (TIGR03067 family)
MKPWWMVAALAACAFGQSSDAQKLQGTWNMVSLSMEGETLPASSFRGAKFVVEGNHFTSSGMGDVYAGTFEVDGARTPKAITLHFTDGPEKGNVNRGIYEVDGDHWRLCLNTRGGAAPARFAAETGTGIALEELQRAAPPDLEGEWSMVSGTFDGQPLPDGYVRMGKRVVAGNEMTVTFGGELYSKATFTVDRTKTPIAIDIQNTGGPNAGKTQYGIYERNGKTLKLSIAGPGRERPSDFTSSTGDGRTVVLWTLKD